MLMTGWYYLSNNLWGWKNMIEWIRIMFVFLSCIMIVICILLLIIQDMLLAQWTWCVTLANLYNQFGDRHMRSDILIRLNRGYVGMEWERWQIIFTHYMYKPPLEIPLAYLICIMGKHIPYMRKGYQPSSHNVVRMLWKTTRWMN